MTDKSFHLRKGLFELGSCPAGIAAPLPGSLTLLPAGQPALVEATRQLADYGVKPGSGRA